MQIHLIQIDRNVKIMSMRIEEYNIHKYIIKIINEFNEIFKSVFIKNYLKI